jgi:D-beta-D-heptose 7-phosphate kinase / D-beta-D-heptose 1-phosphate adenosyltransferase
MRYDKLLELLNEFHRARVLVLGDVMLDRFVYGSVDRISPEAPIPIVTVDRSTDMPGGAANVVSNIAWMGAQATLVGVVGADSEGDALKSLADATPGVQAEFVVDPSRPTTLKTRFVADRQQVMRADRESKTPLSPSIAAKVLDCVRAALATVDVVVLSDYAKGVLTESITAQVIAEARAAHKPVIVDPKIRQFAKYSGATVLTPNRVELQSAVGGECLSDGQIVAGAERILGQGICDAMVVTRGKDGMSVVGRGAAPVHLYTQAREVFDVSGAGDTVLAALALGLAVGGDLVDAAGLANIAAGIVVGKLGTASVTTAEIAAVLNTHNGEQVSAKVFSLERVLAQVHSWRERGFKVAFTNGCFDLLHPGHVSLLTQARNTADKLVVGLNADVSVRGLKGSSRPVQNEVSRATVLSSLKSVDAVVIFAEDTPIGLITALEPDVLVKGADYTIDQVVGADVVMARGGKVVLAKLAQGHSTTKTLERFAAEKPS